MKGVADHVSVKSEDRIAFGNNGFMCLPELISRDEADRLREIMVTLHDSPAGVTHGHRGAISSTPGRAGTVTLLTHVERYTTAFRDSPLRERAFSIARELLGDEVALTCETMIVKPPSSPDSTPWHQDVAFQGSHLSRREISIWVPLQDVDVDGGCMEFVPGSHLGELMPHRPIQGATHAQGLEIAGFDGRFRVVCPLPAGNATVHDGRVIHGTGPNRSAVARYAYILVFAGKVEPHDTPRLINAQSPSNPSTRRRRRIGPRRVLSFALQKGSGLFARLNAFNDRLTWQREQSLSGL